MKLYVQVGIGINVTSDINVVSSNSVYIDSFNQLYLRKPHQGQKSFTTLRETDFTDVS